jgi:23S rRNA pseudouridine955/2504/2580 synthase
VKHIIEAVKIPRRSPEKQAVKPRGEKPFPAVQPQEIGLLQVVFHTIDEGSEGQRLDNFLIRVLKGVPKTHIYRLIRSGQVRVNKHRPSADTRLEMGDVVRVPPVRVATARVLDAHEFEANANGSNLSRARDFEVLYEDEHLLAVAKPAGVAVHGGSGVSFGVIEQLRKSRPEAKFLELVHRLDRETSGVLLLAKKRSALTRLQDQFRERETGKTYLALVAGRWPGNKKVLDQSLHKYLLPNGERRVRVVAKDDPDALHALTLIKAVQHSSPPIDSAMPSGFPREGFSLLQVSIKTGRTHQIRVHLATQGHPIVGDDKYGDFDLNKALEKAGIKRMFLHAHQLSLVHPATQEALLIVCPLDEMLQSIQNRLLLSA